MKQLRVTIIKPSKYGPDGAVERFRRGFMPNSTLLHLKALTPAQVGDRSVIVNTLDEYVQTGISYLDFLSGDECDLLAIAGTQSHQLHRALDLAAFAKSNGVRNVVIGGPHPMTCDTQDMQGRGVSFALSEGELIWPTILHNASTGELQPVYGQGQRWQQDLTAKPLIPPSKSDLRRYVMPMFGIYPSRGCPYTCNFCSVIKIAGQRIRSEGVEITLASLANARQAGVKTVMFTSDNFNKIPEVKNLLRAMIENNLQMRFFAQCDTQIVKDEELIALMSEAGCFMIFLGVESFDRKILKTAQKFQNHPDLYADIIKLMHRYGISAFFSNIIGFPEQSESDVLEHLRQLKKLNPDCAAFYVLTPIPGTEQYADFLRAGLIYENNLDRFDGTHAVWQHPQFNDQQLRQLMLRCYKEFFALDRVLRQVRDRGWCNKSAIVHRGGEFIASLWHRWAAWRGFHPMSGGISRVVRDHASDYATLRRQTFGFDLAPLPQNLELSVTDLAFQQIRRPVAVTH